jgi:transcriptional regulator with GAF, ATPase, and Fis domain
LPAPAPEKQSVWQKKRWRKSTRKSAWPDGYGRFFGPFKNIFPIKEVTFMYNGNGAVFLIAKELTESLEAEACTIRIFDGKNSLELIAAFNAEQRQRFIPIEGTIAGKALLTNEIIPIPDTKREKLYDNDNIIPGIGKSLLAIPFLAEEEDHLLGVAQIYSSKPFSESQISLAKSLSGFVRIALESDQKERMGRKELLRSAKSWTKMINRKEILQCVLNDLSRILEIERCAIYQIDQKYKTCRIIHGIPVGAHGIGLDESMEKHPDIQSVLTAKNIVLIQTPLEDKRTQHIRLIVTQRGINAILYLPFRKLGTIIGIIVIDATGSKQRFSKEEKDYCAELTQFIEWILDRDETAIQVARDLLVSAAGKLKVPVHSIRASLPEIHATIKKCGNGMNCENSKPLFQWMTDLGLSIIEFQEAAANFDGSLKNVQERNEYH